MVKEIVVVLLKEKKIRIERMGKIRMMIVMGWVLEE